MKLVLLFSVLFVSSANAQNIVLGELNGTGQATYSSNQMGVGGEKQFTCKAAMNIVNDQENVGVDFSLLECGGILEQDMGLVMKKIDGQIYGVDSNGKVQLEKGPIGVSQENKEVFILEETRSELVLAEDDFGWGFDCRMNVGGNKRIPLKTEVKHQIIPLTEGYRYIRTSLQQNISMVWKQSDRCPGKKNRTYEIYIVKTEIDVTVK